MSEQVIRSLPIWRGDLEIKTLGGGLTNLNYEVTDGDARYAVRTGDDDPRLGIRRDSELACVRAAAERGIAPALVHGTPGVMVSAFVDGTTLTPELIREGDRIERIAERLRAIHACDVAAHLPYFSPFQVALTYIALAEEGGLAMPEGDADALRAEVRGLRARIAPFLPTFCHNDLMPGNLIDTGDRIWVIDWEYAGIGDPLFDLAGLASNCEFGPEHDDRLLRAYFEGDARRAGEFAVLEAMAGLRESLWAIVQGAQSEIDFDYDAYRDDNWAKYRRAVAALETR